MGRENPLLAPAHVPPDSCWRMIFSENRCPPRIKCGAGSFGIMHWPLGEVSALYQQSSAVGSSQGKSDFAANVRVAVCAAA
jgi:hypothetical protein